VPATTQPRRSTGRILALALGLNLWLTMLVIPALHVRAGITSAAVLGLLGLGSAAVLALGVQRSSRWLLLLGFPATLALAPALEPSLAGTAIYSPATLLPCAAALLGHLAGALHLVSGAGAPPPPARQKRLEGQPVWTHHLARSVRMHVGIAVVAALCPATLLAAVHLRPGAAADLDRSFPDAVPAATVILDLVALGLFAGITFTYLLRPLLCHLDGDRLTLAEDMLERRRLQRASPGIGTLALMGVALVLLAALLLLRYR
jgi:hypothetical protein